MTVIACEQALCLGEKIASVALFNFLTDTTGSEGTGSHAKPTMQPDQQHHKTLILQHKNPKKNADNKLRLDTITNQNYVTTSKNT